MATPLMYDTSFQGLSKTESLPFFAPRTSLPRPLSDATDIFEDDEDLEDLSDHSPMRSVASFGSGSISTVSTASTPDEATTPDSTGLTAFDFHIDEKTVRGPVGPHLFRNSMDSAEYKSIADADMVLQQQQHIPFYHSASKLDPERRDTPIPNRAVPTPQPQPQRTSVARPAPVISPAEVQSWTPRDVVRWMHTLGFDDAIMETFYVNDISGSILLELQTQDLKELGIQSFGKRHRLMSSIQSLLNGTMAANVEQPRPQVPAVAQNPPPTPPLSEPKSDCQSNPSTDEDSTGRKSTESRRRRQQQQHKDKPRKAGDLGPGDSISIVAIEQVLPRLHSCSKGENCRKWQKQQAKLAVLAKDLPIGSLGGAAILHGDPGNPKTAPNLVKTPTDVTPSLIASSDVMGPVQSPGFQLCPEKLNEMKPRDPQENVRHFLNFQNLSKLQPVNHPATPPREMLPSPETESPRSERANPTLSENLSHLPKLMIPGAEPPSPSLSAQRTAIPTNQPYAYGTSASPGDFYRNDPHYGQSTPFSEMDVPVTALPIGPVPRDVSQSVPPNMRFGSNRHIMADPVLRPASTKAENHRRNASFQNLPTLDRLDEGNALNPIETPEDLERTPRAAHCRNNLLSPTGNSPTDFTHSGWMKKRKTTRLLRHEWEDHHFTLQGTDLAMHADEESARRHSKALEHIDVDDYAVACSSLASSSKLTAAFKKTVLKRKDNTQDDTAFAFSLIPAPAGNNAAVDRKAMFLNSGKSHHFAVKTRDERIDWMRELMLAKALKRGRESGAALNVNGNMI
ncbi:hypothetical protein MW887_006849 [Aspergillus wentii]|nr:hypothetical protein MW887_006849 [Aspergillus wentii]